MYEEIIISFKPTEYKYFYDSLRINTDTENILLPIHAYPVLDRENLRNVFPRLIDFGTILIGTTNTIVNTEFYIAISMQFTFHKILFYFYSQTQQLVCKIPINFEFEFTFTKQHADMRILPTKG